MWIFLPNAFVSVVENRNDTTNKTLLVRARAKQHLEVIREWMTQRRHMLTPIIHTPKADYAWRIVVRKDTFGDFLAYKVEHVDYENFKGEASFMLRGLPDEGVRYEAQKTHLLVLHEVWSVVNEAFSKFRRS